MIEPIPADRHDPAGPWPDPAADELIYFLLNVGDGDSQVILLPENSEGRRSLIVVDIAHARKTAQLVDDLVNRDLLIPQGEPIVSLLIATHPHRDHIGGIGGFLREFQGEVREVWSSGLHIPTAAYFDMLDEVRLQAIAYAEPASGSCRYFDTAAVTVLSPGVLVKNFYYSYGIRANDSSICVKIDSPSAVVARRQRALQLTRPSRVTLLLGADAQNLTWSHVRTDFPTVDRREGVSALRAKHLELGFGGNPLRADIFKVSHHGSNRGVSLELVEAIRPKWSLFSCANGTGPSKFPHGVAQDSVREAMNPTAVTGGPQKPDYENRILYTGDISPAPDGTLAPLGSIALGIRPNGENRFRCWRFADQPSATIDLMRARQFNQPPFLA